MPGACPSKPPFIRKFSSQKLPKSPESLPAAAAGASERKITAARSPQNTVRVKVICTDPDATDSSSDDGDADDFQPPPPIPSAKKRVIREFLLPTLSPGLPRLCGSHVEFHADMPKASARRARSNAVKPSQQADMPTRRRKCGKWARGMRLLLGTYDSAEPAAYAYDNGYIYIKRPCSPTKYLVHHQSSKRDLGDGSSVPFRSLDTPENSSASPSENFDAAGELADNDGLLDMFGDEWSDGSISEMTDNGMECKSRDSFSLTSDSLESAEVSLNTEIWQESDGSLDLCMDSSISSSCFVESDSCLEQLGRILEDDHESLDTVSLSIGLDSTIGDSLCNFEFDSEDLCWFEKFRAGP